MQINSNKIIVEKFLFVSTNCDVALALQIPLITISAIIKKKILSELSVENVIKENGWAAEHFSPLPLPGGLDLAVDGSLNNMTRNRH